MNSEKGITPKDIADKHFCIPLYQRLFAWTPKEVTKLLRDLKEHFDSDRFKTEHNPYYLGMLTTINRDNYIELIDGQQRFTVMTLMAIVFKDIPEWNKFLDGGKRIKLFARKEDEGYLRKLSTTENEEYNVEGYENLCMKNAILSISSFLKKEFDDDARRSFAINIYKYMTFFISELPSHYLNESTALNKYFEVLNSTGKGLEQHEILKVKLLRFQENSEKYVRIWNWVSQMDQPVLYKNEDISNGDYAQLYRRTLQECRRGNYDAVINSITAYNDDALGEALTIDIIPVKKKESKQNTMAKEKEDSIISFPEFLLLVLDMTENKCGNDSFYKTDKLLDIFDKNPITDIERFYHNLLYYRLVLDYYVVRKDISNGQSRFVINFRDSDADHREDREQMRQYLSMLTVSTEFYIWLKPYLSHINEFEHDYVSARSIVAILKKWDNAYRKSKRLEPNLLRDQKYPYISRYWFWRLDYYLWERRKELFNKEDERIVGDYVFRTNRSIEHLHPQNEEHNDSWDLEIKNGFGNLALISQSFNSLQHHDNVRVKFARIQEQIDNKSLQSIKMLKMFRMAEEDHSKWKQELAVKHLDEMCKILEESFPTPETE